MHGCQKRDLCAFRKRFCAKKKKEWYSRDRAKYQEPRRPSRNSRHVFMPEYLFCQWVPGYWQVLSTRQNLPSRCLCLGQIVILVLACVQDPPPLRKNLKGPFIRFFLRGGGGGSVTGYLVFVPWADCHFSSDKPRIPALAKMSSFSMTLLHLNKWQLAKCDVISSMHSATNSFPSTPLLGPYSVFTISRKEQHDFAQLIWSTAISLA